MKVPTAVLLKGAWYAAEQCGYLLRHAVILHRAGAYATAAVLALLGREELGAHRLLRQQWKRAVVTHREPEADAIRTALRNHLLKQQHSLLALSYMGQAGGRLDQLTREMLDNPPPSEKYERAHAELHRALRKMAKRAPDERHSTRMRALYVDLKDSGTDWNRPTDLSPTEATKCVLDAVNDYAGLYRLLGMIESVDQRLAAALAVWTDKPALPEPDFGFELFPSAVIGS